MKQAPIRAIFKEISKLNTCPLSLKHQIVR